MSKIDFYTEEIVNNLIPGDDEHNTQHVKHVLKKIIGNESPDKIRGFGHYSSFIDKQRNLDPLPTEIGAYAITVHERTGKMPDIFVDDDKPFIIEICEGIAEIFRVLFKKKTTPTSKCIKVEKGPATYKRT